MSLSDTVTWQAYPSWNQFAWLYCVSFAAGSRGFRLLWQGLTGWEVWLGGAGVLLVCAACLRRWAEYLLMPDRVMIRNGYTGRSIQTIALDDIAGITLSQGPIAQFLNIGTLVIHSKSGNRPLLLQGVTNPQIIKTRLEARRP